MTDARHARPDRVGVGPRARETGPTSEPVVPNQAAAGADAAKRKGPQTVDVVAGRLCHTASCWMPYEAGTAVVPEEHPAWMEAGELKFEPTHFSGYARAIQAGLAAAGSLL